MLSRAGPGRPSVRFELAALALVEGPSPWPCAPGPLHSTRQSYSTISQTGRLKQARPVLTRPGRKVKGCTDWWLPAASMLNSQSTLVRPDEIHCIQLARAIHVFPSPLSRHVNTIQYDERVKMFPAGFPMSMDGGIAIPDVVGAKVELAR